MNPDVGLAFGKNLFSWKLDSADCKGVCHSGGGMFILLFKL